MAGGKSDRPDFVRRVDAYFSPSVLKDGGEEAEDEDEEAENEEKEEGEDEEKEEEEEEEPGFAVKSISEEAAITDFAPVWRDPLG